MSSVFLPFFTNNLPINVITATAEAPI
ncbi:uncharacterized protein METZ01_LOCUS436612, partial [marine metagenome]